MLAAIEMSYCWIFSAVVLGIVGLGCLHILTVLVCKKEKVARAITGIVAALVVGLGVLRVQPVPCHSRNPVAKSINKAIDGEEESVARILPCPCSAAGE